jgi:hypothetical protein
LHAIDVLMNALIAPVSDQSASSMPTTINDALV